MKLFRLEANGFRSYREINLDFGGCQLTRVCGENGAGKSTIIESLAWTIFGRLRDRSGIRAATHRGANEARALSPQHLPCVRWTVAIGGQCLEICRRSGHAEIKNEGQPIATGSRPVTEYMVERLGIDYDDLRATAWCLQGDLMRPISMTKQDRRHLIRRLLMEERESSVDAENRDAKPADTERRAREELKDARTNLEGATSDLKEAEEQESGARKRLDKLRERRTASLEQRSRHEVLCATIGGLERESEGLRRHLDDCVADLLRMREIENRAGRFDPSELDEAIGQQEEDLTELDCLETAVQDTRERRLIRNAAAKARGDWYTAVSDTLASAIARGECSTCERRIWTRHSTLTKKLDNAKAEAKQARLQSASHQRPGVEETELSDDIRRLAREIDARQTRVSNLQYEQGYSEAAKSLLHRIPSQVAKQAELESRLSEVVRCIERRKQELDANGYCDDKHQRLEAEVVDVEIEWRKAREQAQEKRKERDRLDREAWDLAQAAVKKSATAVGVHLAEDAERSRLEKKMDEIVKKLTGGSRRPFAVSVDEDFKPTLHEGDRDGPEKKSGGLDDMVALAMRLALVERMKEKRPLGPICDLVILDEPFGNVDVPRAKGFLERLLEDKERQVLEIGSANLLEPPDSTVCTVCVEDGTAKVDTKT